MWTKSSKGIGIAVCNFKGADVPHSITLRVCDTVVIQEECHGWYKGYLFNDRNVCGIFPSSYVHIKTSHTPSNSSKRESEAQLEREDEHIIEELTETLKEWNKAMRSKYVSAADDTIMMKSAIETETKKLLSLRGKFSAPYITRLQREQFRNEITNKIDWGNKKLGLDLVPRLNGLQVEPDSMSPVELYGIHDLKPTKREQREHKFQAVNSHHLFMQLKNLSNSDRHDDLAIYFSLYSFSTDSPDFISERAMCKLHKDGTITGVDSMELFSAMFVDLTSYDLGLDIYLTAHIYRLGGLRNKEQKQSKNAKPVVAYKRPYGCAAVSLREFLQSRTHAARNEEDMGGFGSDFSMPLLLTRNKDDDFSTITDVLIKKIKEKKLDDKDLETVNVALEMFHGDIRSVKQEYPQFFTKKIKVTQKLGFADVIAPDEVRNDFYLNLFEAEFEKGSKTAERNVEAKVLVVNKTGEVKKCIHSGGGDDCTDHYETAVFYHSNRPRWNEVINISLPIHTFSECHLRIEFRHCPAQGAEKKLFGFSFLPLEDMLQGTTVADGLHTLLLYKAADFSKNKTVHYLELDFKHTNNPSAKTCNQYCSLSSKESCSVKTTLCSTKLTQDVNLLNILKWNSNVEKLEDCLRKVKHIKGDELMRHHADFLGSLFQMTCDPMASQHINLIFEALVHILKFLEEKNFSQFRPMFELYIQNTFCAPLAHRELLSRITEVLQQQHDELLGQVINVLDLLFKFIVRSAMLYAAEHTDKDHMLLDRGMDNFWKALQKVIKSSGHKASGNTGPKNKMALIARVVDVFPDLLQVLPAEKLASSFSETISKIPKRDSDMGEHKLKCLSKLINSPLFQHDDSRRIVLELCDSQLEHCLRSHQDIKLAAQNLSDLLAAIYKSKDVTKEEVESVILKLIRVLCTAIIELGTSDFVGLLISSLITMLKMMDTSLLDQVLTQQCGERTLKPFLLELLRILTGAITRLYIPSDWVVMLMVVNSVILKSAEFISQALTENFLEHFDEQLWEMFFDLCVKFITQPCLQLEMFSERKQSMLRTRYGDMRLNMGQILLRMWNKLSESDERRSLLILLMVGPFLEVSLIPENELRLTIIPVFYDMLQANFQQVHGAFVDKLDFCYNENKGDVSFSNLFSKIMMERVSSEQNPLSAIRMKEYVKSVNVLIQRLLDYRALVMNNTENINTVMLCTVNLLDFYQNDIQRMELYSHYIYKLCDLNLQSKQYTEAAFTLLLNADRLEWTDGSLDKDSSCPRQAEWERKQKHYLKIIKYFDQGQSWEDALPLCKELCRFYETRLCDYNLLSDMLETQARLFKKILNHGVQQQEPRLKSKFYRVAFYGDSLPLCVRNRSFVYRGTPFTNPGSIVSMLKTEFPSLIQLKDSIEAPSADELLPGKQYFQSVIINPEPEIGDKFSGALRTPNHKISDFYHWNQIETFTYDKPFQHPHKDKENEFRNLHMKRFVMTVVKPMPGILHWCEITESKEETLRPIAVAADSLTKKNISMKATVQMYRSDRGRDQQDLSMMLKGTVDAKVNGGIMLYQKAFLTAEYSTENSEHAEYIDKLKQSIQYHMLIVRDGLELFREIASTELRPLMLQLFDEFKFLRSAVMELDPTADIASLNSYESGSHLSATDRLSTDSPRQSSGYSSSDHEHINDNQTPSRKSRSISYSSRDNMNLHLSQDELPSASNLSRGQSWLATESPTNTRAASTRSSSSSKAQRSSSVFYSQAPEVGAEDDIEERSDSSSNSDDEKDKTLTRSSAHAPPALPEKVRSSSFSAQGTLCESPTTPKSPLAVNLANRVLPQTPPEIQRTKLGSKPTRSKTVMGIGASKADSVDYNMPRPLAPKPNMSKPALSPKTAVPLPRRPLPPTPVLEGAEVPPTGAQGGPPPTPARRSVVESAQGLGSAPPIPQKSAVLRNKSQQSFKR